jgi:hypothetical protein
MRRIASGCSVNQSNAGIDVPMTLRQRQLPSDNVYRCDHCWIIGVEAFSADRFAFDVIHAWLDAGQPLLGSVVGRWTGVPKQIAR